MLRELIDLVEPHKEEHPDLYKYLMITWTACRYDSSLYSCNVTGMTIMQRHLSEFDDEVMRFYEKEMAKIKKEPSFWQSYLEEEPICKNLCENWEKIKDEILNLKSEYPNWFTKYPKFKIEDSETKEKVRLYENDWTITALSKLSESYNAENVKAEKVGGSSLEKLIKRYRAKLLPTLHGIINQFEQDNILANVFVSILSPGVIIRPHVGYSKDYMRIHLGLITDPNCKITVGEKTKFWEDGKILAFKDGGPYNHSVIHSGSKDRYILSLDLKLKYLEQYIPSLKEYE
jgi:hypothetical protein